MIMVHEYEYDDDGGDIYDMSYVIYLYYVFCFCIVYLKSYFLIYTSYISDHISYSIYHFWADNIYVNILGIKNLYIVYYIYMLSRKREFAYWSDYSYSEHVGFMTLCFPVLKKNS